MKFTARSIKQDTIIALDPAFGSSAFLSLEHAEELYSSLNSAILQARINQQQMLSPEERKAGADELMAVIEGNAASSDPAPGMRTPVYGDRVRVTLNGSYVATGTLGHSPWVANHGVILDERVDMKVMEEDIKQINKHLKDEVRYDTTTYGNRTVIFAPLFEITLIAPAAPEPFKKGEKIVLNDVHYKGEYTVQHDQTGDTVVVDSILPGEARYPADLFTRAN